MLSWDEDVTPTASLPSSFGLPESRLAERLVTPAICLPSEKKSDALCTTTERAAAQTPTIAGRVNATDKRIIKRNLGVVVTTDSLGANNIYSEIKSIRDKDKFQIPFIDVIMDPSFKTGTPAADQTLLKSLIVLSGLEALFPNEENPFPWMSEMIDLKKERNFFETRVIEYQSGGALSWE